MRCIIAGSREGVTPMDVFIAITNSGWRDSITEVVSGCCKGVDGIGQLWARNKGIPVRHMPAKWRKHGKAAGPIRNQEMADNADALIAVRARGKSDGTDDMIARATKKGLRVYVHRL